MHHTSHMWRSLLIAGVLLMVGCGKPKPLTGTWYLQDQTDKAMLQLAQDGTFVLVAGNDFATGAMEGSYTQTGDKLTLNDRLTGVNVKFSYRWIAPDRLGLKEDSSA